MYQHRHQKQEHQQHHQKRLCVFSFSNKASKKMCRCSSIVSYHNIPCDGLLYSLWYISHFVPTLINYYPKIILKRNISNNRRSQIILYWWLRTCINICNSFINFAYLIISCIVTPDKSVCTILWYLMKTAVVSLCTAICPITYFIFPYHYCWRLYLYLTFFTVVSSDRIFYLIFELSLHSHRLIFWHSILMN